MASLISVSIQGLQQNPQDTSNYYLANIYQTLADPNGTNRSTSPLSPPPPFSPPNHAVWVNALWFLSLVISLTCALLATLLQQWARRYLKITHSRYSPHKRARIRAFFSEGVDRCLLPWTVDALPTLLHISLFLFFAGLVVFLCNVNLTIFKLVLSWVGLCSALYGCITCMPIIRHDSPYYTPLSLPAWHIVTGTRFLVCRFLRWFNWSVRRYSAYFCFRDLEDSCRKSLVRGMQKTAEETALNSPSEIDARAFMWTFDCLDEDHELEHFFAGLPGFRSSNVVDDPLPGLTEEEKSKLYEGLRGLVDRTFLLVSDFLPVPTKTRRAMICAKAVDPEHTPNAFSIINAILSKYQYSGPVATEIAKVLKGWGNNMDEDKILYAQFIILKIVATKQQHDDSWYNLASDVLGYPETSLRDYAAHGDDLSLVILIHVIREQFIHFSKLHWQLRTDFSFVASKFDAKDTSPEIQHKFCALWNHIVITAQYCNEKSMAFHILGRIRDVYLALHRDTASAPIRFSASTSDEDDILWFPSSYPACKVPHHSSNLTPHIHEADAPTTIPRGIPRVHTFFPSLAGPYSPSSSIHTPLPVDETFTDVLPLDYQISIPFSTRVICQTTSEGCRMPTTSSPSPSPKSNASASRSADIAAGRTELSCTPLGDLTVLSSPSPPPIIDSILLTGLLLFSGRNSI